MAWILVRTRLERGAHPGNHARMRLLLLCCLAACAAAGDAVRLVPAFAEARFEHPLWVGQFPGEQDRFLVLEQRGRVVAVTTAGAKETLIDLVDEVRMPKGYSEEGVLAAAFHPKFTENKTLFLWQTTRVTGKLQTILTRRVLGKEGVETLLTLDQPYANHNGGDLRFGADGMLYLSIGDGGSQGDPHRHAQDLGSLFGKILRLDVDHAGNGKPYAIPADNPFVGRAGACPEIWAYGLRNVWRMAFDPATGELWAGDVGQNSHEEVDVIVKGGNYGWNLREGFSSFNDGAKATDMIDPVYDYPRTQGLSVTGGFVYHGAAIPALRGAYLFADWGMRTMWSLRRDGGKAEVQRIAGCPGGPASFGEDGAGEPLVCCFDGAVYRLVAP